MGFSAKQVQALRRHPSHRHVRTREAHGRELSYLEGWYAISEANRIFGFDGWNRETVESRCVLARENRGTFLAVYIADWISRFPRLLMCSGPLILNHLFNVATFFLTPSASASLRASSRSEG
jgi:hypothetical protein